MRTIRYTPDAEADLDGIWEYVARDDVRAANKVLVRITADVDKLARSPSVGHRHADVKDQHAWCYRVYSYLIFYEYDDDILLVLRIVHGARDFRRIFDT